MGPLKFKPDLIEAGLAISDKTTANTEWLATARRERRRGETWRM